MAPDSASPPLAANAPALNWRRRLTELRHDLRNPLGEILGFTEILIDESHDGKRPALEAGLESIRQSANRILADLNHTLEPDTLRSSPGLFATLRSSLQAQAGDIAAVASQLCLDCTATDHESLREDLRRIMASAARLREMMPVTIEILQGDVSLTKSSESSEPFADRRPAAPFAPSARAGTLLVVDDQEANRALLARRLQKRGYTVVTAENGRAALEQLRRQTFDLVLLDIVMPEINGLEVLRQMKADRNLAHLPVLMLSALDELDSVVQCLELGADDFLPKPFRSAILHARVDSCLVKKRMSDQLRKYTGWLFGRTLFSHAVTAPAALTLSRQERTVLFADIRGFTHWSESHAPEEAVGMLNRYFESAELVWANSSVIKTEYTGDEIFGVFGSALDAVQVAHALRVELGRLLASYDLGVGIGVHTGPVIEGLMGGADVKAYRFVGDTVNTARRICSAAKRGEVLLAVPSYRQTREVVRVGPPVEVVMKGKMVPVEVRPLLEFLPPRTIPAAPAAHVLPSPPNAPLE